MSLEFANIICPNCKNPNYMVHLGDLSKVYEYKCMNCNRYFNDIDFEEPLQPIWKKKCMNEKTDINKVIKGFTICSEHGWFTGEDCHGHYEYTDNLADIIKANDYSKQCPYNGCNTGCIKTLAKDVLSLLKEQEAEIRQLRQAVKLE